MDEYIRYIAENNGKSVCVTQTIQELAELIQALTKIGTNRENMPNVVEEMADVEIMLSELKYLFNLDTKKDVLKKIERQMGRLR